MEKIILKGIDELKASERLPKIPELVKKYVDLKKKVADGSHFRISIKQKSDSKSGAGIAYSNELIISKKVEDEWQKEYSTGMQQYRGAYNYETDNWDLSLHDPAILEETAEKVTYALRTGTGNVKVFTFSNGGPKLAVSFNIDDYKKTEEKIGLLQKVLNDSSSFKSYVKNSLGHRWHITDDNELENGNVVVLLTDHADRDYDAISDYYQLFIWVKGKGFGSTEQLRTGLRHPGGKFYRVGIGFSATVVNQKTDAIDLAIEVRNRSQHWNVKHNVRVEWKEAKKSNPFATKVDQAIDEIVKQHQHNHPLYKPTRITEKIIDTKSKTATWILFEQIDTDRNTAEGEGWLGDQFRYSLWVMKENGKPAQIFEDHAYVRPRSKSELTGTRGRDCSLTNLRIEDGTIKVSHPEGEKVEEQKLKELSFKI